MLKGTCKQCGAVFYGWSLVDKYQQWCDCGDELVVEESPGPDLYRKARKEIKDEEEDQG